LSYVGLGLLPSAPSFTGLQNSYRLSMVGKKIFPAVRIISCLYAVPPDAGARVARERFPLHLAKGGNKEGESKEAKKKKTFTVAKTSLKIRSAP